jgi:hypothetical protein
VGVRPLQTAQKRQVGALDKITRVVERRLWSGRYMDDSGEMFLSEQQQERSGQ